MDASLPSTNVDELRKLYSEFHAQYGVTLGEWAGIEQSLCALFVKLCGFDPDHQMGPALFFSGRSFSTRVDLLLAAIRTAALDEAKRDLLRAVLKKARQYSVARNAIAHGVPNHYAHEGNDYQGWRIKEHERAWELGGIGIEQLAEAERNFMELNCICWMVSDHIGAKRRKNQLKPTEWYLERVQSLPNHAYSAEAKV